MPPPTPPATFSSLPERECPQTQLQETLYRRMVAAKALVRMGDKMATPTPSQWFDDNATISSHSETQDYFSGTQPEHLERNQTSYFEGVTGEANRAWTQDQMGDEDEDKEDHNNIETVVGTVVSKKAASTRRNEKETTVGEEKKAITQSLASVDIDSPNKAVEIQIRDSAL